MLLQQAPFCSSGCGKSIDVCVQAVDRPSNYGALGSRVELRRMLLAATACRIEEKMRQVNDLM
jgi:hypothetical protein